MTLPALKIVNGQLQDPAGNRVLLRGVSSQGMCMVYGDQGNPGTYVPLTLQQYVQHAVQTDAQGKPWLSRAIRLCFERFPCTNPGRLNGYTLGRPYAMPDTIPFPAWAPSTSVQEGATATFGGNRWRALKLAWRADRGQSWFPGAYSVGEVRSGVGTNHLYRCTSTPMVLVRPPQDQWDHGPTGTSSTPSIDTFGNGWVYIGEFGQTGATQPFSGTPIPGEFDDGGIPTFPDGNAWWQLEAPDESASQAAADFAAWKSKVLDPAVQAAIDLGLYVVICEFDFGPAHHPLRSARMLDFWPRMATSQWANHPQVLFELWNESEDIGSYAGGAGSWALQKPVIQQTVDAIRLGGAGNIVIVPTPFYSSCAGEATASPIEGFNLGYAWHQYASEWASPTNQQQITQGLASGQAIFITEFGDDSNPTDPANTWLVTLRKLCEPSEGALRPPAGMFAWAETNSWAPSLFTDDHLTVPSVDGRAVRQWLFDKKDDSQPGGGSAPAPVVQTAAPIIDPLASPTSAEPIIITGKLAPVVAPPPPPPPAPSVKTPAQIAADALLADAQLDLAAAQGSAAVAQAALAAAQARAANAQAVIAALAGH